MKNLPTICSQDIVIDTCVLSHSCNPGAPLHESSFAIVQWMFANQDVLWVLDDNGKDQPNPATSALYAEYHRTLPPQSLPLVVLAQYLAFGRVRFSDRPNESMRNLIAKLIPRNRIDRVVLGAAAGSNDKVLVSNDEDDFSSSVREGAEKRLGVQILCSDELTP